MSVFFFLAVAAVLVLVLELRTRKNSLSHFEADYGCSVSLAEPGEPFELHIRFRNTARAFLPYLRFKQRLPQGITVHGGSAREGVNGAYLSGSVWLRPREERTRAFPASAEKRGRYVLRDLTVFGGDFLGLSERSRTVSLFRELVVFPKAAESVRLDEVFGGFLGEVSVNRFLYEDPVLTLGFRGYTGREPMKSISWTQSARAGELMVKNYDYTAEPSLSVVLSISRSAGEDEELIERCFSLTRAVCEKLEKTGAQYDFAMNAAMEGALRRSCYIPEGMGARHLGGILESLGRAGYETVCTPEALARSLSRTAADARGAIFITPERDEAALRAERALKGRGGTVLTLAAKELMG